MSDTTDGFDKKRDHNQYGEVAKDEKDAAENSELPKPNNKGALKDKDE
ncbi:hypothetical protein [Xanthomarina gelatinilytica]|tara:strand:+ start:31986 stop:32129 length:144 start_codon:yes stop_codon:yes gene_type:complete